MLWSKAAGAGGTAGGTAGGGWNISTATLLQSVSVPSVISGPSSLFFKPDGLAIYLCDTDFLKVVEFSLSTPWDISSLTSVYSLDVSNKEGNLRQVFFKPDGSVMYITGSASDSVHSYTLSTAWDISTALYWKPYSLSAQNSFPNGIFFKPDGTKMYTVNYLAHDMDEYTLSTAWDVGSAGFVRTFSLSGEGLYPRGLFFKPDGLVMYSMDTDGDVNQYTLSTAWDISTASFLQDFSVSGEETFPNGIFFKPDGTKMYVVGTGSDNINEYDVSA